MDANMRPLVSCPLYTIIIRQRKKDFVEIEKIEKYKIMFMLDLRITLMCVCVCVCGLYLCVVVWVEYVIVNMCVYDDTCATWQICGCLMNICLAICSAWRDSGWFGWIKKKWCVAMILTKVLYNCGRIFFYIIIFRWLYLIFRFS